MSDDEHMKGLDADGETITLTTSDEFEFEVDLKDAMVSVLVKTSLEDDAAADTIRIGVVEGKTMNKVVEYMQHHKGTEAACVKKPLRSAIMEEVCEDKWDATFIDGVGENVKDLYALIAAANYMDITGLLHLSAGKIASLAKDKSPGEIKEILST